ncbi:MAG TPA: site-2 protease family protein [Pilimelia sp.]|nr:site-2 protease family protein [Pilimelia sp.]
MEDSRQRQRSGPRQPGIAMGRLLGFPLYLNPSALLFAALVTLTYGSFVRRTLDFSPETSYFVGFGFVVCLLASVLLHELGHALTARRHGIGVRGITLELLGGYTEMERDAPNPKVDAQVALAGPAVSLVLGAIAAGATVALPGGGLIHQLAFQLAASNLIVAAFNSLPGLPLDGGRALRAGVWAVTGDRHLGTEVAGWIGRVVAAVTALGAAALAYVGLFSAFGLVFMLLIAVTLWQGAGQAIRLARISRRFPLIELSRLARPVFAVPSGTPLAEAYRRAAEAGRPDAALAVADAAGRLVALVHHGAAEAVPAERRPWVPVDSVARGLDGVATISATLDGEDVIRAVQANPVAEYLVTSGDDVVGVLHVSDLALLLEPKGK